MKKHLTFIFTSDSGIKRTVHIPLNSQQSELLKARITGHKGGRSAGPIYEKVESFIEEVTGEEPLHRPPPTKIPSDGSKK